MGIILSVQEAARRLKVKFSLKQVNENRGGNKGAGSGNRVGLPHLVSMFRDLVQSELQIKNRKGVSGIRMFYAMFAT